MSTESVQTSRENAPCSRDGTPNDGKVAQLAAAEDTLTLKYGGYQTNLQLHSEKQ